MNYAIILAGGKGVRLWPLSSGEQPKQFLNICSGRSMVEESTRRIQNLIPAQNIYIALNSAYRRKIKDCLKGVVIRRRNLFFEPESRNTFAPLAFLSWLIYQEDKRAVISVFPSDHYIENRAAFKKALMDAFEVAQKGYIVTLGIWPDKPDTGYGYIKVSPMLKTPDYRSRRQNLKVYRVDKFIEKPPLRKARQFFKDKRFYWNAGIFIFKAEALVAEVRRLEPQAYRVLQHVKDFSSAKESWRRFPSTSIDYAIMEQAEKMALLPLDCGWVDLGNWLAIEKINKKDKYGNISRGNHYDRDSRDISVWARKRLIVTLGLRSLVVVDTPDALLICAKDKVGGLKEIIARVKAKEE